MVRLILTSILIELQSVVFCMKEHRLFRSFQPLYSANYSYDESLYESEYAHKQFNHLTFISTVTTADSVNNRKIPFDKNFNGISTHFHLLIKICGFLLLSFATTVLAFSFSQHDADETYKTNAQEQAITHKLSISCAELHRQKKIAVLIGEYHNSGYRSINYAEYGPHFEEINSRLRQFGLRTFTQKDITAQIAREEMKAVLNNDPDAAFAAADRLGADFILRGLIRSRAHFNPIVRTNEVFVELSFSLSGKDGRFISSTQANENSWSGVDTHSVVLDLIRENSKQIVADLYHDYCTQR